MGKKKAKLLAQQQGTNTGVQVPWQQIDKDPVRFLIAPEDPEKYFKSKWEQEPAVFKATPERIALFQGLCSFPAMINWLRQRQKKSGPLEFGVDVNAARYKDAVRETPNGEVADADTLQALHNDEGCTLQLHQPQRFFDPCWRLLAALERQLGCLVGSNAYLTPKGSQGLAPHHDDVELWVVQTAGTKSWRVYEPANGYKLPNQPSGDLEQASLGKPIIEVELSVGDVLYLPRGAVHQATAQSTDSSHLTISTFQRASYADLATHLLQVGLLAQDEPECLPLAARKSPKPGTLLQHSLHKVLAASSSTTPDAVNGLAEALRAIADKLQSTPDMLTPAVHSSAIDFLMNRLPPHPKQLPGRGREPTMADRIWCRVAGWAYLLPFEITGMNCEDEEEEGLEEGSVKMVSCLTNSREEHMITLPDDDESSSEEGDSDDSDGEGSEEEGASGQEESEGGSGEAGSEGPVDDDEANGDAKEVQEEAADKEHGQKAVACAAKKKKKHAPGHDHAEGEHHCCGDDGCGHGVHEHSLSSGAGEKANPVAALPGLVVAPAVVKAVVAFMAAETPEQAIAVKDLPLASDAQQLQLAFALWAEGLASTLPAQQQKQKAAAGAGGKQEGKQGEQAQGAKKKGKRPAGGDAADEEETATSSGAKGRPGKKAKA